MGLNDNYIELNNMQMEKAILRQIKEKKKGLGKIMTKKITIEDAGSLMELEFDLMLMEDLAFLRYFTNLEKLTLKNVTGLKDISGLIYCRYLKSLSCINTPIDNFASLLDCRELESFQYSCDQNAEADFRRGPEFFDFLKEFPRLEHVNLEGNVIKDPSFLVESPTLKSLSLSGNPLCSIESLTSLLFLEHLEVSDCGLTALENVEQFKRLRVLYAERNKITLAELNDYKKKCAHMDDIYF